LLPKLLRPNSPLSNPLIGLDASVLGRRLCLLGFDAGLITVSFWGALALRLNGEVGPQLANTSYLLPAAIAIGLLTFLGSGWYRGLTRYSGSLTLYGLPPRAALVALALLLVSTLHGGPQPPRSFWLLFWLLLSVLVMGSRIVLRDLLRFGLQWSGQSQSQGQAKSQGRKTLIYGAGEAGLRLLESLRFDLRFSVVGLLDDDPRLWGRKVQGLAIHRPDQLEALITNQRIHQVLLAMPSTPLSRRSQLVRQLKAMGLEVMAMPSLAQIASGESSVSELRPVAIEELLGREPSEPIPELLQAAVQGEAVLVTGAGGSIGSALCRRVLLQGPKALVLLERNEFALYAIQQELHGKALAEGVELVPVLADVADRARMEMLLRRHGITVLLHAAAYKHVPLVEANVCAGLANNIFGTRSALDAAMACGLKRFTLISTDKAVRPTNVMGASKRVCELLVQDAAAWVAEVGSGPICSMVRFGNVLGSSGSVVPLFREQIMSGGPVTVTHPEITRYFMTIPEAAQLVLQATGMARGGEVFVLDMGEPVKLLDLARQMVELSGYTVRNSLNPDGDIAITFTGLRPGEKLYEELLLSDSDQSTGHPLIRNAKELGLGSDLLTDLLDRLDQALADWDRQVAVGILQSLVKEYQPSSGSPCSAAVSPCGTNQRPAQQITGQSRSL